MYHGTAPGRHLIDREAELEAIDRLLGEAGDGRGGALALLAPAGMGKTLLLGAAEHRARERDFAVLRAGGSRLGREDPWGVARRLLGPIAGDRLGDRALAALPAVRTAEAVTEALLEAAAARPILLALDDLHLADELSLRFLVHLVEHLPAGAVAAVLAARPDGDDDVHALLERVAGAAGVGTRRPAPLSPAAVAVLTDRRLTDLAPDRKEALAAEAAELTAGNPFLVQELLAAAAAETAVGRPVDGRLAAIASAALGERIALWLTDAGEARATVGRAVAVLGEEASVRLVAAVAGLPVEAAVAAVDVLVRLGLVDRGEPVRFVHPVASAVIHDALLPSEAAAAHARAAELLAADGAPSSVVAAHLLHVPRRADAGVARRLADAGADALRAGDPSRAVGLLERALAEPPPDGRAEVLATLGLARAAAGDAGAGRAFGEAIALTEDPVRRAALRRDEGRWLCTIGRRRDAARAFLQARADLHVVAGTAALERELQAAYLGAAVFDVELRPLVERELHAALAGDLAGRSPGERALLAQRAFAETLAAAPRGSVRELCDQAWRAGTLLADEGADGTAWTLVARSLYWVGDLERALEIGEAAAEEAERGGSPLARATAAWCAGPPHLHRGEVDAALADAQRAIAATTIGWARHLGSLHRLHARCLIEKGRLDAASAVVKTALRLPELRHSTELAPLVEARGRLKLLNGDARGALEDFEQAGASAGGAVGGAPPAVLPWRSSAALALHGLGERERALERLDEEQALAERSGVDRAISTVLRVRGLVVGGGDGLEHLSDAVDAMQGDEPRLERTYALVDLGAALRRANRRRDAEPPLRTAFAAAQAGGATALAARADTELRALGVRTRRMTAADRDVLTPSERRVAQHAAAGRTNREIAAALYVSTKTVEYHLGQVFRKLGVRRRTELHELMGAASEGDAA